MDSAARARRVIDAVIESFRSATEAGAANVAPEDRAFAQEVRERFLAAGTERVARELDPDRWLQIGVTFGDARGAEKILAGLAPLVRAQKDAGVFDQFFFMRKPPGLRLRFRGIDLRSRLLPALSAAIEAAGGSWENGLYEAETHQFGGEVGMDVTHDFFSADSFAFLDLLDAEAADPETTDRPTLSLIVLNDLLARVTGDRWEQWDVWKNMALAGRLPPFSPKTREAYAAELEANREMLTLVVQAPKEAASGLSDREKALLERMFEANARIAGRFKEAIRRDELAVGPRKTLPFAIIFHWNRWGLDQTEQLALAFFMEALTNPKAT